MSEFEDITFREIQHFLYCPHRWGLVEREDDKMQLLAQKLSADHLFSSDCHCVFYYADTKKRVDVTFSPSDFVLFHDTLKRIKQCKKEDIIPPKKEGQSCSGCSMDMWCLQKKKK